MTDDNELGFYAYSLNHSLSMDELPRVRIVAPNERPTQHFPWPGSPQFTLR